MTIGDRIKRRREEIGASVEDVAHQLGKHRATIYRYESHEIEKLPTDVLEPLSVVLRTTPAYLLGIEDAPPSNVSPQQTDPLTEDEAAMLAKFRSLTDSQRELFLQLFSLPPERET